MYATVCGSGSYTLHHTIGIYTFLSQPPQLPTSRIYAQFFTRALPLAGVASGKGHGTSISKTGTAGHHLPAVKESTPGRGAPRAARAESRVPGPTCPPSKSRPQEEVWGKAQLLSEATLAA